MTPPRQRQQRANSVIPRELQDVASTSAVDALEARVEKAYSTEKYEEFQTAVKKITLETIDSGDGRTKIKAHARESAEEYSRENGKDSKNFWVPNLIQIAIFLIAAIALIVALFKKG